MTNILRTTGPGMKPACTQAQWNVDRSHIPQAFHGQLFEGQLAGWILIRVSFAFRPNIPVLVGLWREKTPDRRLAALSLHHISRSCPILTPPFLHFCDVFAIHWHWTTLHYYTVSRSLFFNVFLQWSPNKLFPNSNSIRNRVDEELLCGCVIIIIITIIIIVLEVS